MIEYPLNDMDDIKFMVTGSVGKRWSQSHLENTHTDMMADKMDLAGHIYASTRGTVQDSQFINLELFVLSMVMYLCLFTCFLCDEIQVLSIVQMASRGIHGNQIRWWRMKWEPLENTYSDGMAGKMDWARLIYTSRWETVQDSQFIYLDVLFFHPSLSILVCLLFVWQNQGIAQSVNGLTWNPWQPDSGDHFNNAKSLFSFIWFALLSSLFLCCCFDFVPLHPHL